MIVEQGAQNYSKERGFMMIINGSPHLVLTTLPAVWNVLILFQTLIMIFFLSRLSLFLFKMAERQISEILVVLKFWDIICWVSSPDFHLSWNFERYPIARGAVFQNFAKTIFWRVKLGKTTSRTLNRERVMKRFQANNIGAKRRWRMARMEKTNWRRREDPRLRILLSRRATQL